MANSMFTRVCIYSYGLNPLELIQFSGAKMKRGLVSYIMIHVLFTSFHFISFHFHFHYGFFNMPLKEVNVFTCTPTNKYGIIVTETFALILSC